jgi:hypothetical protein
MPPIRSQSSANSTEQEGRILLAIQAFKNGDIISITLATRTYKVPRITLRHRLSGVQHRAISRANLYKLT